MNSTRVLRVHTAKKDSTRSNGGDNHWTRQEGAKTTRGMTFRPEILTRDEVKALLDACSRKSSIGIRNRAAMAVLYRTGLRIGELLALFPRDIDHQKGSITVYFGKKGNYRIVGVDAYALAEVEKWLERRARLGIDGRSTLFCTLQGN